MVPLMKNGGGNGDKIGGAAFPISGPNSTTVCHQFNSKLKSNCHICSNK